MKTTKRIRSKQGDYLAIPLESGRFAAGRVLESPLIAFYDVIFDRFPTLQDVKNRRVAFTIWVMKHATGSGRWKVIGNEMLAPELTVPVNFYKKDIISKKLSIYCQGQERPAKKEECKNLECAAVWSAEHVEDRLIDHFHKRPNIWFESMRLK